MKYGNEQVIPISFYVNEVLEVLPSCLQAR